MPTSVPNANLYINGEWYSSSDKPNQPVHSSSNGKVVTTFTPATSSHCQSAIQAAQKALIGWEGSPPSHRRALLLKVAELLETPKYTERVRRYVCEETSALEYWGVFNSRMAGSTLREAASVASQIKGEMINSETPGCMYLVQRRAVGVVFGISPWNAPVGLALRAISIPLACGNTVILKSSELSPFCIAIVIEAFHEAGIPKGVLNLLHITREDSSALVKEIIAHRHVRKINFTGSDRVGTIIAGVAAQYLKPCVFELGGKAASVVLADADVKAAARAIVAGAMMHSGQVCMSTERVIVQRPVEQALASELKSILSNMTSGSQEVEANKKVNIGPLFSEQHAQTVLSMLRDAQDAGAKILLGDLKADGAVVAPHLVNFGDEKNKDGIRLWERESFGPVITLNTVDTIDDAIEYANDTDYTLTAALWTKSINGIRIASRIRASCVIINGMTFNFEPTHGVAGLGGATGYGRFDIENWTDRRAIVIRPEGETVPMESAILGSNSAT